MTEKEILDYCEKLLKDKGYVSVAWQLKKGLKLNPGEPLIRTIRAKLLAKPEYIEDSQKERDSDYYRIRRKDLGLKERYSLSYDLLIGCAGGIIGAFATWFLTPKEHQTDLQLLNK